MVVAAFVAGTLLASGAWVAVLFLHKDSPSIPGTAAAPAGLLADVRAALAGEIPDVTEVHGTLADIVYAGAPDYSYKVSPRPVHLVYGANGVQVFTSSWTAIDGPTGARTWCADGLLYMVWGADWNTTSRATSIVREEYSASGCSIHKALDPDRWSDDLANATPTSVSPMGDGFVATATSVRGAFNVTFDGAMHAARVQVFGVAGEPIADLWVERGMRQAVALPPGERVPMYVDVCSSSGATEFSWRLGRLPFSLPLRDLHFTYVEAGNRSGSVGSRHSFQVGDPADASGSWLEYKDVDADARLSKGDVAVLHHRNDGGRGAERLDDDWSGKMAPETHGSCPAGSS
ncbi:MAG: hypothetical protein V4510_13260 [bacterium]